MLNDEQGACYIESVGGWDSYRAACLHDLSMAAEEGLDTDDMDPGEDPGRAAWGLMGALVCDSCADELREAVATGADLGLSIVSDEEAQA
jgi:hypothetical protein